MARFAIAGADAYERAPTERDRGLRTRFLRPGGLEALGREAGLADVRTATLATDTSCAGFDDFWTAAAGSGLAFGAYVDSLPPDERPRLRDAVRAAYLAGDEDGPRSWAARVGGRGRRARLTDQPFHAPQANAAQPARNAKPPNGATAPSPRVPVSASR